MRSMYDGIYATNLPADAVMVAGYVNGKWPSYYEMLARYPNATCVSIAVSADANADVLDVERYDATPADSVDWTLRQRARNAIPTVYCSTSLWPSVVASFTARNVLIPLWWAAQYDGDPTLPTGAVAKQHTNTGPWDLSSVADYWPGIDPKPYTPTTGDYEMRDYIVQVPGDPAVYLVKADLSSKVHISNPVDLAALLATGQYLRINLDAAQMKGIKTL